MELKTVKRGTSPGEVKPEVSGFLLFKGHRMVSIKGSFPRGQFQLSQKKVQAVLDNLEVMKQFAAGDFDESIDNLSDEEFLSVS